MFNNLRKSSFIFLITFSNILFFQSSVKADQWEVNVPQVARCNGYETNKFNKKAEIEAGDWTVAWADDVSETDVALGVVAVGIDVYGGSGAAFTLWAENLVQRTLTCSDPK